MGTQDTDPVHDLMEKHGGYWGEHPEYPAEDWKMGVANGDTRQSYWQWVLSQIEQAENGKEG